VSVPVGVGIARQHPPVRGVVVVAIAVLERIPRLVAVAAQDQGAGAESVPVLVAVAELLILTDHGPLGRLGGLRVVGARPAAGGQPEQRRRDRRRMDRDETRRADGWKQPGLVWGIRVCAHGLSPFRLEITGRAFQLRDRATTRGCRFYFARRSSI